MDADRKQKTWDCLYKSIYTEKDWSFWGLFDFTKPINGIVTFKEGLNKDEVDSCYKTFIDTVTENMKDKKFYISGDADWNTKKWTPKEEYIPKMHMFPNFSIMPCTGGMNNKKGNFGYKDNFSRFLYILSGFYNIDKKNNSERRTYVEEYLWYNSWKKRSPIKSRKTIKPLLEYLNLFDGINDYCKKIYLLDDSDFITRIITYGEKVHNKERCMEEEKDLAEEYWKARKNKLPECCLSLLDKDIDAKDYE